MKWLLRSQRLVSILKSEINHKTSPFVNNTIITKFSGSNQIQIRSSSNQINSSPLKESSVRQSHSAALKIRDKPNLIEEIQFGKLRKAMPIPVTEDEWPMQPNPNIDPFKATIFLFPGLGILEIF